MDEPSQAEQFSLKWNNFSSNLTSGFLSHLSEGNLVDVTIAVDGHLLHAHKLVLSICSPYFRSIFKENPCQHPVVILKDTKYTDVEALLKFMYQGEVNVKQEDLPMFLKVAQTLQVRGLAEELDSNASLHNIHYFDTAKISKEAGLHLDNTAIKHEDQPKRKLEDSHKIRSKRSRTSSVHTENIQSMVTSENKEQIDDEFYCANENVRSSLKLPKTVTSEEETTSETDVNALEDDDNVIEEGLVKISSQTGRSYQSAKKRKVTKRAFLPSRFTGQHFPIVIETTSSRRAKKRCVVCSSQKKRRETIYQCDNCNVAICINHFKCYHTAQNN